MRFAIDFHSWLRHSWKLLANRLTRDPKIVIHGNSCIILYIKHIEDWSIQFYFFDTFYLQASKLCGSYDPLCDVVPSMVTWASCQIRKIMDCACAGRPGTFSRPPLVSDPDMHHGTCVAHVPWRMPGSQTSGFCILGKSVVGKTFPAFPVHTQSVMLRIW